MAVQETFTGTTRFYKGYYPEGEPESLSVNGAISTDCFLTDLSGNTAMTLSAGESGQLKFINTQSGANTTITCSLDQSVDAYVSFDLGANNKCLLLYTGDYWAILESKPVPLTKNL